MTLRNLLHLHGIEGPAAEATLEVGRELRAHTLQHGVECGAMVDLADGQQIGSGVVGRNSEVDFAPILQLLRPAHTYVQLHVHPNNTSFSLDDVRLLLTYPNIHCSIVIGATGTWYFLSRRRGAKVVAASAATFIWQVEYETVERELRTDVFSGRLEIREAQRELPHRICEQIAGLLGLRYHRWQPTQ